MQKISYESNTPRQIIWKTNTPINGYEYSLSLAQFEEIHLISEQVNAEELLEVWHLHHMSVENALKNTFYFQQNNGQMLTAFSMTKEYIKESIKKSKKNNFEHKNKCIWPIYSLYQKHVEQEYYPFNPYEDSKEKIIGMGGFIPLNPKVFSPTSLIAEPWFLGEDMDKHARFLALYAKEILAHFLDVYPILINVVGAWNKRSIRWLRSLGFIVEKNPHKYANSHAFFHRFYITKEMFSAFHQNK